MPDIVIHMPDHSVDQDYRRLEMDWRDLWKAQRDGNPPDDMQDRIELINAYMMQIEDFSDLKKQWEYHWVHCDAEWNSDDPNSTV